jgi:pimeloyl-ACP methyl ester carboxylesterase
MATWTKATCKSNGINLHYLRTGGKKPPVILLHGLMLSGACWTPLARALEEHYDVIMPDARGHGYSDAPDHGYRYNDLASDVEGLIDALELTAPVLVGHSMGGMTAAVVASRKPLQGLILADPTFLTPQRQQAVHESDVAEQHRRILNQPKEVHLAESRARHRSRSDELIEIFANARYQTSINAFQVLTPPNPDYVQLIKAITVPSLLVTGDKGAIVTPEMAAELAELNHRLALVQIEDAGHAVPYDQPERFSVVVGNYLRGVC